MGTLFLTKEARIYNEAKTASSINGPGKTGQSIPVLLPGKSHGQRSLVGYSLWGHKESDTTELLHFTSFTVHAQKALRNVYVLMYILLYTYPNTLPHFT